MTRTLVLRAAATALVAAVAGCADGAAGQPLSSSSPPLSPPPSVLSSEPVSSPSASANPSPVLPTIDRRPSGPPLDPSDQIKKTSWVVGTVTTGGSGPCYGLTTDDGTRYALHAADGTKLVKGARMRIQTRAARVRIYCGPGTLVEMVAAEPVR